MHDPLLAARHQAAGGNWPGAGRREHEFPSWPVIIAESLQPAEAGLKREHEIADEIAAGVRAPTIFVWQCQRALIVARSQTHWPGYAAAAAALAETGWPVLVRRSGGGSFPIGPGTAQVAMIARYPNQRTSMDSVYERLGFLIGSALAELSVAVHIGGTPGAFCNGRHDLAVGNRKVAGLAQHWRLCGRGERCVTAAASVLVDAELRELAEIVDRFHTICGQEIDIRSEAMTTVRDSCNAPRRDLMPKFLAHLAAAAGEWRMASSE